MNGKAEGKNVVIQAFDFVPKADLAVELFDGGEPDPVAYRATHGLTAGDVPMNAVYNRIIESEKRIQNAIQDRVQDALQARRDQTAQPPTGTPTKPYQPQ